MEFCDELAKSVNDTSPYDEKPLMFWGFTILYLLLALFAVIGNGLVIAATYISEINENYNALQLFVPLTCFVQVIRSLALSDLLYGFIGAPFQIYGYYLGESKKFNVKKQH